MICAMRRNLIVSLLILGWVALSGLDLLEDLKHLPGQVLVSDASSSDKVKSNRDWGALANNIVESANRVPETVAALCAPAVLVGGVEAAVDFRGYFRRHKLYQVYLI
jgi:hypothetical protein